VAQGELPVKKKVRTVRFSTKEAALEYMSKLPLMMCDNGGHCRGCYEAGWKAASMAVINALQKNQPPECNARGGA
jgi:hypothetical protein